MLYTDRLNEHRCKILVYYVMKLKLFGTAVVSAWSVPAGGLRGNLSRKRTSSEDQSIVIDRSYAGTNTLTMALHFYPGQLRQEYDMN